MPTPVENKIFVDTLFVVALINQRDVYHDRALALADVYEKNSLVIADAVLLKIGNALSRNYKREAVEVIETLCAANDTEVVHLTDELIRRRGKHSITAFKPS